MAKNEALGKGIRALLENIDSESTTPVQNSKIGTPATQMTGTMEIELEKIEINPFQPRADFDQERLKELSESIQVHGIIQPLTVRKLNANKFQLIAGERRLRASKMAGLTKVPAYIRVADDTEMLELGLIENIQRENLNPIEISISYQRLIEECSINAEELGGRVGKNRTTVTNYLRLLKLPPQIQKALQEKVITMGHARALINVERLQDQISIFHEVVKQRLSVRQTEDAVRSLGIKTPPTSPKKKTELSLEEKDIQNRLASALSTKVKVSPKSNSRGELTISYYSNSDLQRILEIVEN